MKNGFLLSLICSLFFLATTSAHGKKKTETVHEIEQKNMRVLHLSAEDQELFDQLTKKQQKMISASQIDEGYNAWMVRLALGEPYYNTEHHPIYTNYEQVWLYTKDKKVENVSENKIIDPVTNWPSIHRMKNIKSCTVGDFFLLFDRGVVEKIIEDTSNKIYGSCRIETVEEFLPIVDGKVIENPR